MTFRNKRIIQFKNNIPRNNRKPIRYSLNVTQNGTFERGRLDVGAFEHYVNCNILLDDSGPGENGILIFGRVPKILHYSKI